MNSTKLQGFVGGFISFMRKRVLLSSGLPKDAENLKEMPCVMNKLCELHDGLVVEAKGIKEHYFKPYMKTLYEKRVRHMPL